MSQANNMTDQAYLQPAGCVIYFPRLNIQAVDELIENHQLTPFLVLARALYYDSSVWRSDFPKRVYSCGTVPDFHRVSQTEGYNITYTGFQSERQGWRMRTQKIGG